MNGDFFALFDLPPEFDIDLAQLESRYIELQNQLHPDRIAAKGGQEKLAAQGRAIDVNAAYQALKNPLTRAAYLLRSGGADFDIESERTVHDQELLVEMMDRREQAFEVSTLDGYAQFLRQINLDMAAVYPDLSKSIAVKNWDAAKKMLLRLQYMQKIEKDVREKQQAVLDGAA